MQDFPPVVPDFEDTAVASPTTRVAADVRPHAPRLPRPFGPMIIPPDPPHHTVVRSTGTGDRTVLRRSPHL